MAGNYNFEESTMWQKAHEITLNVYKATKTFPEDEIASLTALIRKTSVKIASKIAKGYGKRRINDKVNLFNEAQDAIAECRYYVTLSKDLGYFTEEQADELSKELLLNQKMVSAYLESLIRNHSNNY
ncbi:MAG: four helix bundle protein [Tannerellaceae bacterium]|nr:four helix bundle protein [Tannerellaceae bacterium]